MGYYYDDINYEFEQRFEWEVVYSVTTKEGIIRLQEDKKLKTSKYAKDRKHYRPFNYNVFEVETICEEFAGIDIESLKSIDDFVNKRGILGLHIENKNTNLEDEYFQFKNIAEYAASTRDWERLDKAISAVNTSNNINKIFLQEDLGSFIKEVKLMRAILTLNSFDVIRVSDEEEVKSIIKEIEDLANIEFEMKFPEKVSNGTSSFILLQHKARALISGVIVLKMKNVKPKLGLTYKKGEGYTYIDTWQPRSLLGCMYTMLYNDLSQGTKTTICLGCGKPVIIRGKRSEPYHASCQGRKHTANTRERQTAEAKKYIVGKYANKPDVSADEIFNKERDYIYAKIGKSALFNKKRANEWLNRK